MAIFNSSTIMPLATLNGVLIIKAYIRIVIQNVTKILVQYI